MVESNLYNSTICRLCAEDDVNGELLFASRNEEPKLCYLVNCYLTLEVEDDGKLPCTICRNCYVQLMETVQFFEVLMAGQRKLRNLYNQQHDKKKDCSEMKPSTVAHSKHKENCDVVSHNKGSKNVNEKCRRSKRKQRADLHSPAPTKTKRVKSHSKSVGVAQPTQLNKTSNIEMSHSNSTKTSEFSSKCNETLMINPESMEVTRQENREVEIVADQVIARCDECNQEFRSKKACAQFLKNRFYMEPLTGDNVIFSNGMIPPSQQIVHQSLKSRVDHTCVVCGQAQTFDSSLSLGGNDNNYLVRNESVEEKSCEIKCLEGEGENIDVARGKEHGEMEMSDQSKVGVPEDISHEVEIVQVATVSEISVVFVEDEIPIAIEEVEVIDEGSRFHEPTDSTDAVVVENPVGGSEVATYDCEEYGAGEELDEHTDSHLSKETPTCKFMGIIAARVPADSDVRSSDYISTHWM